MLRISVVDFLNARPLTWGLLHEPPPGVEVSRDMPSVCAAKLASGEADVGLIPSIEYQRIPGLRVVPSLGIAASSEVRSVLLVSDVSRREDPLGRPRSGVADVGGADADPAQAGLRARAGVPGGGRREAGGRPADARLIIGDPAMKTRLNGHVVLDLASEWRAFSGHPFVFAFWAVREDRATAEVAALLRRSYEAGLAAFDAMVREEAASSGLSEPVVEDYLRHALHFELDARRSRGPAALLPARRRGRPHSRGGATALSLVSCLLVSTSGPQSHWGQ